MGFLLSGGSIFFGGVVGTLLKRYVKQGELRVLGLGIMLLSSVGIIENLLGVNGEKLESGQLLVVLFAVMFGGFIGESVGLERRLSSISVNGLMGTVISGSVFFGVGALQISGPIALALFGDNSMLILKALIDFPFAVTFGAAYGMGISLSGIPVVLVQLLIAMIAYAAQNFLGEDFVRAICATGYVILFLMGLNLSGISENKVNTMNLLPSILVLIAYQIFRMFL